MAHAALDSRDAVARELGSATGLSTARLSVALKALRLGDAATLDQLMRKATAVARLCDSFGFQGAVRFPHAESGPDCWFLPTEDETVGLIVAATETPADEGRSMEAPVPAPREANAQINGLQAGIVQAFLRVQKGDPATYRGKWLVIYTRLSGVSEPLWDMLRTRFAGEDQIAPFARAFVVDVGDVTRGFEL